MTVSPALFASCGSRLQVLIVISSNHEREETMRTRRQTLIFFICVSLVFASCVVAFAQSTAQEKAAKAAQDKAQAEVFQVEVGPPMGRRPVGFAMAGGE